MASNNLHSTPKGNSLFNKSGRPDKRFRDSEKRGLQLSPDVSKVCARCNNDFKKGDNFMQCKGCKLFFVVDVLNCLRQHLILF